MLSARKVSKHSKLAAKLLLIQVGARQSKFSGVIDELDLLLKQIPQSDRNLQAKVANELVRTCFYSDNLAMGTQKGEEFFVKYEKVWAEPDIVELLCQLSTCHFHRGDSRRAEELIERALMLAKTSQSKQGAHYA